MKKKYSLLLIVLILFLSSNLVKAYSEIPDEELDVIVEEDMNAIPYETPVPTPEAFEYEIHSYEPNQPQNTDVPEDIAINEEKSIDIETEPAKESNRKEEISNLQVNHEVPQQGYEESEQEENLIEETTETEEKQEESRKRNLILDAIYKVNVEINKHLLENGIAEFTLSELYDNSNCVIMTENGEKSSHSQEEENHMNEDSSRKKLVITITVMIFTTLALIAGGILIGLKARQLKKEQAENAIAHQEMTQALEELDVENYQKQAREFVEDKRQQSLDAYEQKLEEMANVHKIAIDPGHQAKGNSEQEPIGPGASETKKKVSSGTTGKTSGLAEYELNLIVSLQLRDELEKRGYEVFMIRETHDVNISNSERAQMAAESGAEILVRIHANGSTNTSVTGAMTMSPGENNPFLSQELIESSYRLSECIIEHFIQETEAKSYGVQIYDNMSGINWSTIPVTIVEMGHMTNPEEDLLMASAEYQAKMVKGMADGIDAYFAR